jgi:hypothetical protein
MQSRGGTSSGWRLHQGGRQPRHLLGKVAVGRHGSQLVLPQIQQLFRQLGGVDGLF